MNVHDAVPVLVNWLVPRRCMSVQYVAEASQKLTAPDVTVKPLAVTVAVSITGLPETAVVTGLPPEVAASVVSVGTDCDQPREVSQQPAIIRVARITTWQRILACKINLKLLSAAGKVSRFFIRAGISVSPIQPALKTLVTRDWESRARTRAGELGPNEFKVPLCVDELVSE
jgi:hypothetical protein